MPDDTILRRLQLAPLRRHPHIASEIASQLHAEWGSLAPWAHPSAIEQRLLRSSGDAIFPYTLIALAEGGRFAGTASIKLRELERHPDKEHWLGEVFVPKEMRGCGLGTLLVNEVARYAFEAGAGALYLYTPDQQALYARLGWRQCGEEIVNAEAVTIMVRYNDAKHQA